MSLAVTEHVLWWQEEGYPSYIAKRFLLEMQNSSSHAKLNLAYPQENAKNTDSLSYHLIVLLSPVLVLERAQPVPQ